MINLSNSKLISILSKLLILLVVAKTISLSVWWFCPSEGVELNIKENYQPKYQRVNFKNMIIKEKQEVAKDTKTTQADSGISITNMILKGLYGTKERGFIIVAMKSTPKATSIIEVGESFGGYKLTSILKNGATLYKNGSDFILNLDKIKATASITRVVKDKVAISVVDAPSKVSRGDIAYYAKNPKQIWRDISIREVKDGKKIVGFRVFKINPDSKFATLGLKKGDLIIKANNVKLESYRDALQIYKKIDKLDTIQIVVIRDNQEVELVYEIN